MARKRIKQLLDVNGTKTVDSYHKELGKIMTDKCSVSRNEQGLKQAISDIKDLRTDFWRNVRVTGQDKNVNSELEKAGRVADYLELAELMCIDALTRNESCGAHFREEYQTEDGEALRDDEHFRFISCWEYREEQEPELHKEELLFEEVKLVSRDYKR